MDSPLITFINQKTDKYSDYRVKDVIADTSKLSIVIEFVYPQDISITEQLTRGLIEEELKNYASEFLELPGWNIIIKLNKSHYDAYTLKDFIQKQLSKYPAISAIIKPENVVVDKKDIFLDCDDRIHNYIVASQIEQTINNSLYANFCDTPKFQSRLKHKFTKEELDNALISDVKAPEVTDIELRRIKVINRETFIGELITADATYIKDVISEGEVIICGVISDKKEYRTKEKDKPFFKFTLTDPTAKIDVLYFPNKSVLEKSAQMADGDTVILSGNVKADKFRDKSSYTVSARNITYCSLPSNFQEVIHYKPVPKTYNMVKPVPFIPESVQMTFLDFDNQKSVPKYLKDKTFVVFDLETTGVDMLVDKVTEICGIKIRDGILIEVFSTFVDPEIPVPEEITKLTGINDVMVAGKPKIHEIIPDFFKFCDGAVLVAHNASFDMGFIKRFSTPLDYYFNHTVIDTLALSRKNLKLSKYKLENLAEHYGFKNKGAHRAVYDTEVLSYIFINLCEFLD